MAQPTRFSRLVSSTRWLTSTKHTEVMSASNVLPKDDSVIACTNDGISQKSSDDSASKEILGKFTSFVRENMIRVHTASALLPRNNNGSKSLNRPTSAIHDQTAPSFGETISDLNESIKQYYYGEDTKTELMDCSVTNDKSKLDKKKLADILSKKQQISTVRRLRASQLEVSDRMKSLCVNFMAKNISAVSRLTRLRELIDHLKKYPECGHIAEQHGMVPFLLKIRDSKMKRSSLSENKLLVATVREALAALGHTNRLNSKGIRILSIDGGGTRGLVAIESLKQLEILCQQPIHQLFDYICGVSTGGLLAVLVGAMRLPLNECIAVYKECSEKMFTRSTLAGAANLIAKHSFYDTSIWENILKEEIGAERTMLSTARDAATPRLGLVSTVMSDLPHNYVFRNYEHVSGTISQYSGGCSANVWEAIRASSAAPGFFEEFKLGETVHQDGGVLNNNPTAIAVHEAKLLWPNKPIQCVVSLGNGRYEPVIENTTQNLTSLKTKIGAFVQSATSTEGVHTVLHDLLDPAVYYRFNPYMSEEFLLNEIRPDKLKQMQFEAQMYLRRNASKLQKAGKQLQLQRKVSTKVLDLLQTTTNSWSITTGSSGQQLARAVRT